MPQGRSLRAKQSRAATPRDGTVQESEALVCAMRLRVYLTPRQNQRAAQILLVTHRFHNAAVAWLTNRRRQRAAWLRANRSQPKESMPTALMGSDALACSRWLTDQLTQARERVRIELGLGIGAHKNNWGDALAEAWPHLSRGERESLGDAALWLTVPRTALSQVVQDLGRTISRAIKDRVEAKTAKATKVAGKESANPEKREGKKVSLPALFSPHRTARLSTPAPTGPVADSVAIPGAQAKGFGQCSRMAGFPVFHRWCYATSYRMQVEASKNRAFRDHWAAGELFIPGLGRVPFRDRQALPKTPPKLITLARDAAGRWHVSFLCVAGEGRAQDRQQKLFAQPLVLDLATGLPACGSADAGFKDSMISHEGKRTGSGWYLRRQLKQLGHLQRGLSRKTHGSSRWKKTKRQIGRLHAKVTQQRDAAQQRLAQELVAPHPILCLENLYLQGMLQKAMRWPTPSKRLGRALRRAGYDTALGKLNARIERQAAVRGHLILRCGRFDPSTQVCHRCGHRNRNLTLADRTWTCPGCNTLLDRDVNAAINVRTMALKKAIDLLSNTPSESEGRTLSSHRLRPDLAAFVARGGLTLWLEHLSFSQGQAMEARVWPESRVPERKGAAQQR